MNFFLKTHLFSTVYQSSRQINCRRTGIEAQTKTGSDASPRPGGGASGLFGAAAGSKSRAYQPTSEARPRPQRKRGPLEIIPSISRFNE